jgi:uncharacterized protein YoxC
MSLLTIITLVIVLVVVLVLVVYLVGIILALRRAGNELERLAGGLQKIVDDTTPLKERVGTINGALGQLREGLGSVDRHLVGVARAMKL